MSSCRATNGNTNITDAQIESLETEADQAFDWEMVGICRIALVGAGEYERHGSLNLDDRARARLAHMTRARARATCAAAINEARAQEVQS